MTIPTIPKQQAESEGYEPITRGYYQHEDRMMERVIRDMRGIEACLVEIHNHGTEVWRKGKIK